MRPATVEGERVVEQQDQGGVTKAAIWGEGGGGVCLVGERRAWEEARRDWCRDTNTDVSLEEPTHLVLERVEV